MKNEGDALHQRRDQIDNLDSQLLHLLNQRAHLAQEVASIKSSAGLPVYDGRREQQILDRVCELNQGPLDSDGVASIFRCIIHESRKIEEISLQRMQQNSLRQENPNGDQHGGKRIRG